MNRAWPRAALISSSGSRVWTTSAIKPHSSGMPAARVLGSGTLDFEDEHVSLMQIGRARSRNAGVFGDSRGSGLSVEVEARIPPTWSICNIRICSTGIKRRAAERARQDESPGVIRAPPHRQVSRRCWRTRANRPRDIPSRRGAESCARSHITSPTTAASSFVPGNQIDTWPASQDTELQDSSRLWYGLQCNELIIFGISLKQSGVSRMIGSFMKSVAYRS